MQLSFPIKLSELVSLICDFIYDVRYHVKTCGNLRGANFRSKLNFDYEPSHYSQLYRLFSKYPFDDKSHFIDFGCGKGRTLVVAMKLGCKYVTGVEINSTLCDIAAHNINVVKARDKLLCNSHVVNCDAREFEVDERTNYFFFFNPFHMKVFHYVLKAIQKSVIESPREVILIFLGPRESTIKVINDFDFFTLVESNKKRDYVVYSATRNHHQIKEERRYNAE